MLRLGPRLPQSHIALHYLTGPALKHETLDLVAYFDRPHASNGPTETINGRLKHLHVSALVFRNLTNPQTTTPILKSH